jgi:tetratricopeptide (TPR) repeat protein
VSVLANKPSRHFEEGIMKRLLVSFGVACSLSACSASVPDKPDQQKPAAELAITSKSPEAIDHFRKGRDFADNVRQAEAQSEFDQALKLDPDFALALAYRGSMIPGPEGLKDIEQASAKAGSASKGEQLFINGTLAGRRGEFAKSEDLWKQATETVPGDWRVHMSRGFQLGFSEKYDAQIDEMKKAVDLNPNAGPAYNQLGYAYLAQGNPAAAVEPLKKYASLAPNEPNPQDSLGEALLANGQFAEAEAAFRKAISLSPAFSVSWEGVAYSKMFGRDWAGGKEAVAKAKEAATRPADRITAERLGAFGTLAEGKSADGLKQLDALAKSPDASALDVAFTSVNRGIVLVEGARYREALSEAAKAIESADGGKLPVGGAANVRRFALAVSAAAHGRMGNAAGAQQTVEALQKESTAHSDDPLVASTLHFAQGMLAVARKDMKSARAHFDMCSPQDTYCHWQSLEVSRKAGNKVDADASLTRLTRIYIRDPIYLYARSTVTPAPKQTK